MNAQSHFMATQLATIDRYAEGIREVPRNIVEEWIKNFSQKFREIYESGEHDILNIEERLYKI